MGQNTLTSNLFHPQETDQTLHAQTNHTFDHQVTYTGSGTIVDQVPSNKLTFENKTEMNSMVHND